MPVTPPDVLALHERFVGFDSFDSPRVVIDEPTLLRNIAAMADLAGDRVTLHPHVKTHKCLEIARLQKMQGAAGFTAARPNEALMLLADGLAPVTLAYPVISPAIVSQLLEAAAQEGDIRFIADSPAGVAAIVEAAQRLGRRASVFMKVDVGLHRCGVDPTDARALALAAMIARDPSLVFAGLLSHAGHAYGAGNPHSIQAVADTERKLMLALRRQLEAEGISVPTVSIGSTPSLIANAGFDGIDEIRPGNYVFYDLTAVRLGLVSRNDLSLGVATRVISANDRYAIANIGSKTLSSDLGAHGTSGTSTYGEAWIKGRNEPLTVTKLSEEHAFLTFSDQPVDIGTPLLVLPNHSCPVANLSGGAMTFLGGASGQPRRVPVEGIAST